MTMIGNQDEFQLFNSYVKELGQIKLLNYRSDIDKSFTNLWMKEYVKKLINYYSNSNNIYSKSNLALMNNFVKILAEAPYKDMIYLIIDKLKSDYFQKLQYNAGMSLRESFIPYIGFSLEY